MKRLVTFVAALALLGAVAVAPVLADTATTTTGSTGIAHAIDCFGLMLTDPAKHATECGGPTFTPAPPPDAGGDGNSCFRKGAEITPFDANGDRVESDADQLIATESSCEPD